MNRRDFLKGLGAALACYGGANLLPRPQRNALIEWGKENGVVRPVWQGWTPAQYTWHSSQVTRWANGGENPASETITLNLSAELWAGWKNKDSLLDRHLKMTYRFSPGQTWVLPVRLQRVQQSPDGSAVLYLERALRWEVV